LIPDAQPLGNIDDRVAFVDDLAHGLFFELRCVFGSLHLHFSHSDFDNNICLLNWGNANWYLQAAAQDDAVALSNLGFMYDHGQGVPADSQKALNYYSKAAKKGDENAKRNRELIEARIAKQHSNHP
jgi:hypothetical protein